MNWKQRLTPQAAYSYKFGGTGIIGKTIDSTKTSYELQLLHISLDQ
jgi:hypothetical protein